MPIAVPDSFSLSIGGILSVGMCLSPSLTASSVYSHIHLHIQSQILRASKTQPLTHGTAGGFCGRTFNSGLMIDCVSELTVVTAKGIPRTDDVAVVVLTRAVESPGVRP
jgi:hypothetical protein